MQHKSTDIWSFYKHLELSLLLWTLNIRGVGNVFHVLPTLGMMWVYRPYERWIWGPSGIGNLKGILGGT